MAESYRDRPGDDPETGAAIQVRDQRREVILAMGVMRNFGSLSEDAWAAMTPAEARELARDLEFAAHRAEARHG